MSLDLIHNELCDFAKSQKLSIPQLHHLEYEVLKPEKYFHGPHHKISAHNIFFFNIRSHDCKALLF